MIQDDAAGGKQVVEDTKSKTPNSIWLPHCMPEGSDHQASVGGLWRRGGNVGTVAYQYLRDGAEVMSLEHLVNTAAALVAARRYDDARQTLLGAVRSLDEWPTNVTGFGGLRTLARSYREARDYEKARQVAEKALEVALQLDARVVAVALEGLALIEAADRRIRAAAQYFAASAELERQLGNTEGRVAALSNHANMLTNEQLDGAEALLREALASVGPGDDGYGPLAHNLAGELERQGRYDDASRYARDAVIEFQAKGLEFDTYLTLRTLSRLLLAGGDVEEAASTFREAHDLILRIRADEIDESHYSGYAQRVEAIERRTQELFADVEFAFLQIGFHAHAGELLREQAFKELENGHISAALVSLSKSREHWVALRADHILLSVDYHTALAHNEAGTYAEALQIGFSVRQAAHDLGDGFREQMALSLIARLASTRPGIDALDYLAQAVALSPAVRTQLGATRDQLVDAGVMQFQLGNICGRAGAFDLSEAYFREAVDIARRLPEAFAWRLAYRLANLYSVLDLEGKFDDARVVCEELTRLAESSDDARVKRAVTAVGTTAALREGRRDAALLREFVDQIEAYEALRHGVGDIELSGFADEHEPPFDDAVALAIELGDARLALHLFERGRSRALLEAVGGVQGPADRQEQSTLPAVGDAVGVCLFLEGHRVSLIVHDGRSNTTTAEILVTGEAVPVFTATIESLIDAGDAERAPFANAEALDQLLRDPVFVAVGTALERAVGTGRRGWVAPHGLLHHAPLQLTQVATGGRRDVAAVVPALSVVEHLPPMPRELGPSAGLVVAGDPSGDLPFARVEARVVGQGGTCAVGARCTVAWLETALARPAAVLHLACHGRFDRYRRDRTGIVLAAPPERPVGVATELLPASRIASMPLRGAIVLLSACSTGREQIRGGDEAVGMVSAFLAAGASAVVAAQWPVDDLSSFLLMRRLHDALRYESCSLAEALALGSEAVRELHADTLVDIGFDLGSKLVDLGAEAAEVNAVTGRLVQRALFASGHRLAAEVLDEVLRERVDSDIESFNASLEALVPPAAQLHGVQPFAHPRHWGAFKIVGRTAAEEEA